MFSIFKKNKKIPIFLSNTLHNRKKEQLIPRKNIVTMYSCGPTVYNYAHLGNLRSYIFADTLSRSLKYLGHKVQHVINITDVGHLVSDDDDGEDKMEKGAAREGKTAEEISTFYTQQFFNDLDTLHIEKKSVIFPRATNFIKEQISLIQKLEQKGYTYKTSDGIYFNTKKFPTYGELGGTNLKGLKEGARVKSNPEKKNPTDFALWKFSGIEKRQQEWDSPWGIGFPGWHIECSAMVMKILGEQIDIHTGGVDHIAIHHNNEIAQSEGVTGKQFAQFWLHGEFLITEGEKMSKSKDNFLRIQSILDKHIHPLAYRYFVLTAHYRSPLAFSWQALKASETALFRLSNILKKYPPKGKINDRYVAQAKKLIADDLDTSRTIALLWEILKDTDITGADKKATIFDIDKVLGLDLCNLETNDVQISPEVQTLLGKRLKARQEKNWKLSDELREKIEAQGLEIKDTPTGQEVVEK